MLWDRWRCTSDRLKPVNSNDWEVFACNSIKLDLTTLEKELVSVWAAGTGKVCIMGSLQDKQLFLSGIINL
jgi:hypothetical protein